MLIVIVSNATALLNEAAHINELFKQGMQIFHLRKPSYTFEQMEELVRGIEPMYYENLVLHQHHALTQRFNIKRIHFPEQHRQRTDEGELQKLKNMGYILSTSIHDLKDHGTLSNVFDYAFYGPVYDSISKPDHKPKSKELPKLKEEERRTKIIAIGGVDADKIMQLQEAGFDGAALLGAVWGKLNNETFN